MAHDTNWAAFGPNGLIREKKKRKKKLSCYMTLITTSTRH